MRNESSLALILVAVVLFGIVFSDILMELRQDVERKRTGLEVDLKQYTDLMEKLAELARENNSEWKKDFRVIAIISELSKLEGKIRLGYQEYNKSVAIYNEKMKEFPFSLVSKIQGFQEETCFETS